jgi:hypothetical protein
MFPKAAPQLDILFTGGDNRFARADDKSVSNRPWAGIRTPWPKLETYQHQSASKYISTQAHTSYRSAENLNHGAGGYDGVLL